MTDGHQPARALRLEGDAFGQASLMLVESLIHELMTRSVLTVGQAITVIEVARDAQQAVADDMRDPGQAQAAADLLQDMMTSLQAELIRD